MYVELKNGWESRDPLRENRDTTINVLHGSRLLMLEVCTSLLSMAVLSPGWQTTCLFVCVSLSSSLMLFKHFAYAFSIVNALDGFAKKCCY